MTRAIRRPPRLTILLGAVLLGALAVRLHGITFGLPALYDPDEPLFIISGLRLLGQKTLNPDWFGHPGTTTIYALALIDLATLLIGELTGAFRTAADFGVAVYLDPAIVALPSRLFVVACGVACVFLTWLIGRRLFDERVALTGAALLAVNPLHVQYSQIIRTDVHATVFMLLCVLASLAIVRHSRPRDYIAAGMLIGLATATKWPAATIAACPFGACILRAIEHPDERWRQARWLATILIVAVVTLFVVSPYLLIDRQRLLDNLHGEARLTHLGATGGGFAANLIWYLVQPIRLSMGWLGLALACAGFAIGGIRSRAFLATGVLGSLVFLIAISAQALIWTRWILPLLPMLSIAVAVALSALTDLAARYGGKRSRLALGTLLFASLAIPMMADLRAQEIERRNDTRGLASAWVRSHVPANRTILVEHFAFDLIGQRWTMLFPAGMNGCIDATRTLKGKIQSSTVDGWRSGRAIMNIGTIDPARLESCRTDYAIFSYYDRYRVEPRGFDRERALYNRFLANGAIVATFAPEPGRIGGPIVRIVRLNPVPGPFLAGPPAATPPPPAPIAPDSRRSARS